MGIYSHGNNLPCHMCLCRGKIILFSLRSDKKTPVAMATYIVHILLMGKVEIKIFSVSKGIFGFLLQNASLSSPLRFI